jgi:hypothetical protein
MIKGDLAESSICDLFATGKTKPKNGILSGIQTAG